MKPTSGLVLLKDYASNPLDMFKKLLSIVNSEMTFLNLATSDSKFGVLNRTVVFRGISNNGAMIFVTQRESRKYANLMKDPRVAVTLYFPEVCSPQTDKESDADVGENWQVRLMDAQAHELKPEEISALWKEEPLFAKMRSHVCKCGEPVEWEELKKRHDQLLEECEGKELEQTAEYTAFGITANIWDFLKSENDKISDRVQYTKNGNDWKIQHVAA